MEFMWLYSLCQCILFVSVIVVSVRLCVAITGGGAVADVQEGTQGATHQSGSVSSCLRLCLGWIGAVGGAVEVPVNMFMNLRTPQCLYICITLVCCPLLVRQFTMFLLMLLVLDSHLQHHLADRYSSVVTLQRTLCVVLLCWIGSVLLSFAECLGSDLLHTWRSRETGQDPGTAGLAGLGGNWTTSIPRPTPSSFPKYYQDIKIIGKYLPYGGFLSKFYVEGMHNFTYAEMHSSHWGVCAPDSVLSPHFLVYVYGSTVFMLPLLCLLAIYLDLLCRKSRETPFTHADPSKHDSCWLRSLALSISLLVLLCLPLHIIHALFLFNPSTNVPVWVHAVAVFLFQLYSLVPPLLFTPPKKTGGFGQGPFPLSVSHIPPVGEPSRGKAVHKVLCEAVQVAQWSSAKHSLKAKVFPEV